MTLAFEKLGHYIDEAPKSKVAVLTQFGHKESPTESSIPDEVFDFTEEFGGADAGRTRDLLNAIQALSQLSYSPTVREEFQLTSGTLQSQPGLFASPVRKSRQMIATDLLCTLA